MGVKTKTGKALKEQATSDTEAKVEDSKQAKTEAPLSPTEANELALLLTRAQNRGQMEPEHVMRMGKLRERAGSYNLEQCQKKHRYYTVSGASLVGCHYCAGRMK